MGRWRGALHWSVSILRNQPKCELPTDSAWPVLRMCAPCGLGQFEVPPLPAGGGHSDAHYFGSPLLRHFDPHFSWLTGTLEIRSALRTWFVDMRSAGAFESPPVSHFADTEVLPIDAAQIASLTVPAHLVARSGALLPLTATPAPVQ